MDIEILEILKSIQGDVKSMKSDIKTMQGDINSMQGDINSMQGDIKSMKDDITEANHRIGSLEKKTDKNTLLLEDLNKKVQIVGEVQASHKEENEKSFKNIDSVIEEKASIMELSVRSVSKDVKEVKESIEVLKDMTGRHEVDINILKRRPV